MIEANQHARAAGLWRLDERWREVSEVEMLLARG